MVWGHRSSINLAANRICLCFKYRTPTLVFLVCFRHIANLSTMTTLGSKMAYRLKARTLECWQACRDASQLPSIPAFQPLHSSVYFGEIPRRFRAKKN